MELKASNVVFIADCHRYLLGNRDLMGITSTLIPALFGDYTKDIPEDVLARAAERGTAIHEDIERIDEGRSFAMSYETMEYVRLRDDLGLVPVRSEYIVTDKKHFASPIDKVYEGDIIADIKTTSELHYAEVCFQLSWYATYYQAMNGRKVEKAYVIWLPKEQYGKAAFIRIPLIRATVIRKIVSDYLKGYDISVFAPMFAPQLPAHSSGIITKIKALKSKLATMESRVKEMENVLIEGFKALGVKSFENKEIRITRVDATERVSIDSKRLKEEQPDTYAEYSKVSKVKESVRITIKD